MVMARSNSLIKLIIRWEADPAIATSPTIGDSLKWALLWPNIDNCATRALADGYHGAAPQQATDGADLLVWLGLSCELWRISSTLDHGGTTVVDLCLCQSLDGFNSLCSFVNRLPCWKLINASVPISLREPIATVQPSYGNSHVVAKSLLLEVVGVKATNEL
ncbi:hypothetical protein TIFTF001_029848 [Ficus carica]|uniref:Uncharacterized protein n=1 Tax=Ficus carica TaxID=3494 RepID=A0AA88J206_FICCA|nr:hypothetical protein TIFTF001_029848 [Ficus carica]